MKKLRSALKNCQVAKNKGLPSHWLWRVIRTCSLSTNRPSEWMFNHGNSFGIKSMNLLPEEKLFSFRHIIYKKRMTLPVGLFYLAKERLLQMEHLKTSKIN